MILAGKALLNWAGDLATEFYNNSLPDCPQKVRVQKGESTYMKEFPGSYPLLTRAFMDAYSHAIFQRIEQSDENTPLFTKKQMLSFVKWKLIETGILIELDQNDIVKWHREEKKGKLILPKHLDK